jgi:hypothetical protein
MNKDVKFRILKPACLTFILLFLLNFSTVFAQQSPYGGSSIAIPGKIEAEDFDNGGEGIAYHDGDDSNNGNEYRTTGVDIEVCNEGGFDVGWTSADEWLEYTVNVAEDSLYLFRFRMASGADGGDFHIEFDGIDVTSTKHLNGTGGWGNWTTLEIYDVALTQGEHVMKIVFETGGINFNYVSIFTSPDLEQLPFSGSPIAIPGIIEAEDFDEGGEFLAYQDAEPENIGGVTEYRETGVDIEACDEGGYCVGNTAWGEWLEYTVNVEEDGLYLFQFRMALGADGGNLHVEIDGINVISSRHFSGTGGSQNWKTLNIYNAALTKGEHVMRIVFETGGINLNNISIVSSPVLVQFPFSGSPISIPGKIEAEDFDEGGEGLAYHDEDESNNGNAGRQTGVDIDRCSEGGYNVALFKTDEWLEYTVDVTASGSYFFLVRYTSWDAGDGGNFHIEIDGINVTSSIHLNRTDYYQDWATYGSDAVSVTQGEHIIRFVCDN